MLEGPVAPVLQPSALSSSNNRKLPKFLLPQTDLSEMSPPAGFDLRWSRTLNGWLPSSEALAPIVGSDVRPGPCFAVIVDPFCACLGRGVPEDLFEDGLGMCPLALNESVFNQLAAANWSIAGSRCCLF